MGVSKNQYDFEDDATKLVLDIVRKVLEPSLKETIKLQDDHRKSSVINENINFTQIPGLNVKYKKWSENDCSCNNVTPLYQQSNNTISYEGNFIKNVNLNNFKSDFWAQYCDDYNSTKFISSNSSKQYAKNWRGKNMDQTLGNRVFQLQRNESNHVKRNIRKHCSFCKKNGESYEYYTSHSLYENGKTICPILKQCLCNICGQSGHTMSHCIYNSSKNSILKMIHRFNMMK